MALGQPDVDGMLARMSSRQLTEWMIFYQLEPWGEKRADLRAGIVAATVANVHRGKKDKALKAEDFMPELPGDEEADADGPDWERLLERVRAINAAFGGQDLRQ